jgi:nucleoside-diphosphate-sugar epimerase
VENLLVIGCGDIARRALPELKRRWRVAALVRSLDPVLADSGVELIEGDLDDSKSLSPLAGRATLVAHFAPPTQFGSVDLRTRNLLSALSMPTPPGGMLPQRFLYLSTSGVYGDCSGEFVDETRPPKPRTERARRRDDAERTLVQWGAGRGVETVILRVPGIYASDRLPLERLRRGAPALRAEEDVYTNHIHADDLAAIVVAALSSKRGRGIYNASDDSETRMGDFFDLVADRAGLARPPRVSRAEAARAMPADLFSFMSESRRLVNRRMKTELGVRLRYPTVSDGIPRITEPA